MGKGGGGGISGYRYFMSVFMGVCRGPIDALLAIKVGDVTAWTGIVTDNTTVSINQPNLFGGDTKEGGIAGSLEIYMGGNAQVLSAGAQASLNGQGLEVLPVDGSGFEDPTVDPVVVPAGTGLVPGYRGVFTLMYKGLICSNNPYPKPWKMRHYRATKGWDGDPWYPETALIMMVSGQNGAAQDIFAMNGAHIIYECATNSLWGRGLDRALIDDTSFRAAALQLYNEGFGLCLRWTRTTTLSDFVGMVVNHIGAAVYIDRTTGLFTLSLLRGDYDPDALPLYDKNSGLLDVSDDASSSSDTSANEVIVTYRDPVRDEQRSSRIQSLAGIQSSGAVISTTTDYQGLPTPVLAVRVAARDLKIQTSSLKKYVVKVDRRGWRLAPGGLLRISDPSRSIANVVLRIGKVEDSTSGDGSIVLTCLQDVFGLPDTVYTAVQDSLWTTPPTAPALLTRRAFKEASYRDFLKNLTSAQIDSFPDDSGGIISWASQPQILSPQFRLETKIGSESFVAHGDGKYAPSARLPVPIDAGQTSFTLDRGANWDKISLGTALLIDDEWMRVDSFDTTTGDITVGRGCLDTVPVAHGQAWAFFIDGSGTGDNREYVSGETVEGKLLTVTTSGVLDESLAPTESVDIVARHFLPYPPGLLKVDGVAFALISPVGSVGDRVFTWAHRDRITQADALISQENTTIGPEAGTTYTVRIYQLDDTLLRTTTGITGTTWTYTTVMQGADVAGHKVRVELESVRDGVASYTRYSLLVPLISAGWGFGWGFSWGVRP
jgi:hypothetical protein